MKLQSLQNFSNQIYNNKGTSPFVTTLLPKQIVSNSKSNIAFGNFGDVVALEKKVAPRLQKALAYLEATKLEYGYTGRSDKFYENYFKFSDFDLDKLNGIQDEIKVFKGMTLKEINFAYSNLSSIMVNRGCNNRCTHCYVNALPEVFHKNPNKISKMAWEDFSSLMTGIDKLNQRLGFKALKTNEGGALALFHDSDCINIEMKDKSGKLYDFTEINDLAYKSTKHVGLFDTSGWTPKDKKAQARAEKIVKYFMNGANRNKVNHINISLNPFHGLNEKSIMHKLYGNVEGAKKMRGLYTDRMANVLYTFTPLASNGQLNFILRALPNEKNAHIGYRVSDMQLLVKEILIKLETRYNDDLKNTPKYLHNKKQIKSIMETYKDKLTNVSIFLVPSGRGENFFTHAQKSATMQDHGKNPYRYVNYGLTGVRYQKGIDANGKLYAMDTHGYYIIPTDIQFNFENKNKTTEPLNAIMNDIKITKEMINANHNYG